MDTARKNVALLAACQALLFTNNSILITVNGLAGYALAPDKALATLTSARTSRSSHSRSLPSGCQLAFVGGAA